MGGYDGKNHKTRYIGRQAMQITIYYTEEDEDLIDLVATAAKIERKSKGALMLSVLEDYFEKKRELEAAVH